MMDIGVITPLDFGAVGDGVTDDTTALTNTFANTTHKIIDLGGKTYGFTAALNITQDNITLRNGTLKYI